MAYGFGGRVPVFHTAIDGFREEIAVDIPHAICFWALELLSSRNAIQRAMSLPI